MSKWLELTEQEANIVLASVLSHRLRLVRQGPIDDVPWRAVINKLCPLANRIACDLTNQDEIQINWWDPGATDPTPDPHQGQATGEGATMTELSVEASLCLARMRAAGVTVRIVPKPPGSAAHVHIQLGNVMYQYGYVWDVERTILAAYDAWRKTEGNA